MRLPTLAWEYKAQILQSFASYLFFSLLANVVPRNAAIPWPSYNDSYAIIERDANSFIAWDSCTMKLFGATGPERGSSDVPLFSAYSNTLAPSLRCLGCVALSFVHKLLDVTYTLRNGTDIRFTE